MTIGFIGTGHITAAMVEGLCTARVPPGPIVVSPRNAEKAAALAARFPEVTVAPDNQTVVDAADTLFLAVRPQVAPEVLQGLRFREDQRVVSLIALRPMPVLREWLAPARRIFRAVPIPANARHEGPVAYFPSDPGMGQFFGRIGVPVGVDDEAAFQRLWSLTGLLGPYYALMDRITGWAAEGGVPPVEATAYTTALFDAVAGMARGGHADFAALSAECATPGGINEQGLGILRETDALAPWAAALDAIYARMLKGAG